MPISLLCDEHIPYQVTEGLRRRGIDVVTVQHLGLRSVQDETILDSARQQGRVVYTNDADFLRLHGRGVHHAGIFYHHILDYSIGEALRIVALACEVFSEVSNMNERITIDAKIHHGKPVIKGTRVPLVAIIGGMAGGMSIEDVCREYDVTLEDVRAALGYAAELIDKERVYPIATLQ